MKKLFLMIALASASIVGCEDGHKHDGDHHGEGDCADIITACHDADEAGNENAAECHDIGHDGVQAACTAAKAECLAKCSSDAGDDDGGELSDAGDAG